MQEPAEEYYQKVERQANQAQNQHIPTVQDIQKDYLMKKDQYQTKAKLMKWLLILSLIAFISYWTYTNQNQIQDKFQLLREKIINKNTTTLETTTNQSNDSFINGQSSFGSTSTETTVINTETILTEKIQTERIQIEERIFTGGAKITEQRIYLTGLQTPQIENVEYERKKKEQIIFLGGRLQRPQIGNFEYEQKVKESDL